MIVSHDLPDDSDDGGQDDDHDQPLVNLKDKLRGLTETHDLVSIIERHTCNCLISGNF